MLFFPALYLQFKDYSEAHGRSRETGQIPQSESSKEGSEKPGLSVFRGVFQSGTDLAIYGNSRKENPGFKSRRIIILPCTFAKPWVSVRRKMGFSSTGRLNKAQLKNFGLPPVQSAMDLDRSHKMSFFHTGSTATCWARTAASRAVLQGGKRPGASSCVFSGTCRVAGLVTACRLPRGKAQELPAPPQWLLPEEIFHTAPTSKVSRSGRDMHADVAQPGRGRAGWFSA